YSRIEHRQCIFISHAYGNNLNSPVDAEIRDFQKRYGQELQDEKPVVFVRHETNHYFAVVFDFRRRRCLSFGRDYTVRDTIVRVDNWKVWDGPKLWENLSRLCQIAQPLPPLSVTAVEWKQNGVDCGAYATAMTKSLIQRGIPPDDILGDVELECPHRVRQSILNSMLWDCPAAYRWYQNNHGEPPGLSYAQLEALRRGMNALASVTDVLSAISRAITKCTSCRKKSQTQQQRPRPFPSLSGDSTNSESDRRPQVLQPRSLRKKTIAAPRVYRPVSFTIPLTVPRYRPIHKAHRQNGTYFDDYTDGPSMEDNTGVPIAILNFPVDPYAKQIYRSIWTMFRDYGYRLEPSFYQLFNREPPMMVAEHLLPVPPHVILPKHVDGALSLSKLLKLASKHNADLDVLVCGRNPTQGRDQNDRDLLTVDPTLDAIPGIEPTISIDIDSVIWVAHRLRFKLSVKIQIGITFTKEAPIAKSNHVNVYLLNPRSEKDIAVHGSERQEWVTTSHGLHTIPHMSFAQCGDGSGSFNAYIFFPRMKHKSEHCRRAVSIIPAPVQEHFIKKVLLPAVRKVVHPSGESYTQDTLEDLAFKAHTSGSAPKKTIPLDCSQIVALQDAMADLIAGNEDLSIYGSFFFVVDARGIKLWTVDGVGLGETPLDALYRQFPSLDWDYMMDRHNGELLLDLGIGFHPPKNYVQPMSTHPDTTAASRAEPFPRGEALVGLWLLDFLKESYQMAGYYQPTTHHSCTFASLGNTQAEMSDARQKATHIVFRQSYNVAFEVVRHGRHKFALCREEVAYRGQTKFRDSTAEFVSALQRAANKSYGLREEIRMGGAALKSVRYSVRDL
ncbi:hypothetical protein FS837_001843, partial [Tulasnella sp. UAMH 9824]